MRTEKEKRTLEDLVPGERGIILRVGSDKGAVKRRLVDMGLTPGTEVMVRKVAPFGDPIEVNLRGYELSLRKEDAAQITLATGEEAQACRSERKRRSGMIQRVPDEETLRRMSAAHQHEEAEHSCVPDYASHDTREMKLALVGNPNCGKTTLFNALTGSNQYVGNWPGVTVEKKEGRAEVDGKPVTVVDLPGIYSLSPYSMEEIVARDFIVGEHPDAIIDIIDATNIERNLYLTAQLLELERPMVIALNFMDEVEKHGDKIDVERLSRALGVPVIPITARSGKNIQELLRGGPPADARGRHRGARRPVRRLHPPDPPQGGRADPRQGLRRRHPRPLGLHQAHRGGRPGGEGPGPDRETRGQAGGDLPGVRGGLRPGRPGDPDRRRPLPVHPEVVSRCVQRGRPLGAPTLSDRIDAVVTHKFLAVPVFLLMMLAMFALTFGPGQVLSDGVDVLISGYFAGGSGRFWPPRAPPPGWRPCWWTA